MNNFCELSPRVLSIQSHVVHGYVGNKSAVFPLQVLGFEVDSINTVQFSTHTAYKHIKVCDPVMGDNGQMYVPEEILPVYRDIVVPLADILTPNQFEAELLSGLKITDLNGALKAIEALHNKGVKTVVLSSTDLGVDDAIIAIASTKGGSCYKIEMLKQDATFTGTGDLFASLFLAWSHKTNNDVKLTLEKTIATLQSIVLDTFKKARAIQPTGKIPPALIELRLIQNKSTIEDPIIEINAVKVNPL
ncbi:unnamed protein product [Diatraea saccharalis]|uniref:Pyridoxal kinase n=1 Tax=Diatraea saccharalis TaxID=40085 RepID=A0A9P0C670_9NEOP|nr:unnamed protein product [Diatraea saccharalis]